MGVLGIAEYLQGGKKTAGVGRACPCCNRKTYENENEHERRQKQYELEVAVVCGGAHAQRRFVSRPSPPLQEMPASKWSLIDR